MPISTLVKRRLADAGTVRVLTHNIYGQSADWTDRRQVLVDGIRELSPDLIALQETIRTNDYDQVVDLVGAEYHVVQHRATINVHHATAAQCIAGAVVLECDSPQRRVARAVRHALTSPRPEHSDSVMRAYSLLMSRLQW